MPDESLWDDENRETRIPGVPIVEPLPERGALGPVARTPRSEKGCTYDPRPGQKCPVCGKQHLRTGRSVKIHVPAGDAKPDFKKGQKK